MAPHLFEPCELGGGSCAEDRVSRLRSGEAGIYLKQQLKDKLVEHRQYIEKHGEDLPEIRNWKWDNPK